MRQYHILLFTALLAALTVAAWQSSPSSPILASTLDPMDPMLAPVPVAFSPCATFDEAPNKDEAETNYVLYRDFLKTREYDIAYDYWKKVYATAPAADGQRNTVFSDGIFFYEYFLSQTSDWSYVDSIFLMYDEIDKCYPEGGYVAGRKAFDLYYKYRDRATRKEIFDLFKESIEKDGIKANDFVINPFTALLTELHDSSLVSNEEAKAYSDQIREIIAHGLENCQEPYCERWRIVNDYAPVRLEYFETVKGFYDCEHYSAKYFPMFEEQPDSCDLAREVFSRLNWGGCVEGDIAYDAVKAVLDSDDCRLEFAGNAGVGVKCLQEGDYDCAIEYLLLAAQEEDESIRKSELLLLVSKVYYVHKRNYPSARTYAQQAADARAGWGEPYILIGRMYASSGPLCGPGRGWDSQIVVWVAVDMWNKAKRVDASVSSEANKWIREYSQYMPEKGDIFLRNLSVGDSYFVPCWIQRSTTIRAAR
ncbi:MAG: hypothetical protein AAFZ63_21455 [Bacteroidota bacterium]